jgi:geranylgeranyl diphosphate synthase type 3
MAVSPTERDYTKVIREPYEYICQVKGKGIRLLLVNAFDYWLHIPAERKAEIGVLTQMLHNASLLIDDIEDNSKLRRGIPVAHNVFGVAQTINSANFIYFEALQRTLKLGHPDAVNIYTTQLVELHLGQGKDIYWRDSHSCPSEPEYMQMVREKTGGLFMLGIALMQLFSENKTDFTPLVEMLGLYFQIRDDYANLSSEEYAENKSFCEDLTEGKYSFPIIHGIRETSFSSQLKNILRQRTEDIDVKKYFLRCLQEAGSLDYTRQILEDLESRYRN